MYFTSWDANTFLCLLSLFPEEVVRRMIKMVKREHEEHVIYQARSWHCCHTLLPVSTLNLYTLTIREFKGKWSKRIPEQRRENLVKFCKNGTDWVVQSYMRDLSGYKGYYPEYMDMSKQERENIIGINEFLRGLWATWSAWTYSIEDRNLDTPEWDGDEEEEYFDMKERYRREYVSDWYHSIHEGRYFLFFKENDICKNNIKEKFSGRNISMYNLLKYHQMGQDLLTLDGEELGKSPGSKIEHIDDLIEFG